MNQYDSLMVGKERKIWNPFSKNDPNEGEEVVEYPKNITLKQVFVDNLYNNVTLLNMSFFSDADPEGMFRKLFTNAIIHKEGVYNVNQRIQCHDYVVLKVETVEGFHTKTMDCSEMSHTETFVTKMSSLISKVNFVTDYSQLASEIIQPIEEGEILNEADYLKRNDINQAISSGLAKKSYDEEIMYHLKKKTGESDFNMLQVSFDKSVPLESASCSRFKFVVYMFVGYPYYML